MSKYSLATKLADELGTTVSKASRMIDDIGYTRAARLTDDSALSAGGMDLASKVPSGWWKPAGVVGGAGLGYKYLDQQKAEQLATEASADSQQATTVRDIMQMLAEDETLTPAQRLELYRQLAGAMNDGGGGGGGGGGDGGLLGGDVQTTLVLVIVVAFALKFTLGDDD